MSFGNFMQGFQYPSLTIQGHRGFLYNMCTVM